MIKDWRYKNTDTNEKSLIKRLLASRGITEEEDIKDFVSPTVDIMTSPYAFCDMEKAVTRLQQAIYNNENIVIYGDFDADGVTSTSILYKTLTHLGASVSYFIPDREAEGHGFDISALTKIMIKNKPRVIISVDCGISDVDAIKFINSFKTIDVIITDHHEAPEVLPEAYAIINPKAPNSLDENLSAKQIKYLTYLAGCGVAFKVAQAILGKYDKCAFLEKIFPFVAIGTIADVVPLLGENRYLVNKGLDLISRGKHEGIQRLLKSAGFDITKGLTAENVAFGIAPRINASGRLDTVDAAIKLLISDNMQEVEMSIQKLNELNKVRQTLCQETFEQAEEMLKKEGNNNPAIILANEEWHIGIVGIVASKLVEKYYKPTFLMKYVKEKQQYRCSARSVEGVPLYDVISANPDLYDGFGGHTLAAGLSFSEEKTSFETVKQTLNDTIRDYTSSQEIKPFIDIDMELSPEDITTELVEILAELEPYGASNPNPIFALNNLKVKESRLMGNNNSHLRLTLTDGLKEFTAVWWQVGDIGLSAGDVVDIAFHPQLNVYNGTTSVQLIIDDIHSDVLTAKEQQSQNTSKYKIYDHRNKTSILSDVNDYIKKSKFKIGVFAESKSVKETLKNFEEINNKITNRNNLAQCDILMLFDYPASIEALQELLDKSQAKKIHFMNYEPKYFEKTEFLTTFNGMLKFAHKNNNGRVDIIRCISYLGKTEKIFELLVSLYEERNFIKVLNRTPYYYEIEIVDLQQSLSLVNDKNFDEIFDLAIECENFQRMLSEDNLELLLN